MCSGRKPTILPAPPASTDGAGTRFIAGEPMKPATNMFAGFSYSSSGVPTCWRRPRFITAMRSPIVTHDQVEAMTIGDRIAVMNLGLLQQVGTPEELTEVHHRNAVAHRH